MKYSSCFGVSMFEVCVFNIAVNIYTVRVVFFFAITQAVSATTLVDTEARRPGEKPVAGLFPRACFQTYACRKLRWTAMVSFEQSNAKGYRRSGVL